MPPAAPPTRSSEWRSSRPPAAWSLDGGHGPRRGRIFSRACGRGHCCWSYLRRGDSHFLGATPGPGVAIVAVAFGLCAGAGAVLLSLARRKRVRCRTETINCFAYNFIKIHRSLRMSPAMAAGI